MSKQLPPPTIHNKNLCLGCRFFLENKCKKQPLDYCRITRSN